MGRALLMALPLPPTSACCLEAQDQVSSFLHSPLLSSAAAPLPQDDPNEQGGCPQASQDPQGQRYSSQPRPAHRACREMGGLRAQARSLLTVPPLRLGCVCFSDLLQPLTCSWPLLACFWKTKSEPVRKESLKLGGICLVGVFPFFSSEWGGHRLGCSLGRVWAGVAEAWVWVH